MLVHPEFYLRHRSDALNMFRESMQQMHPETRIRELVTVDNKKLQIDGSNYSLANGPLWVIGAGKAVHTMATALESVVGDFIQGGLIVTQHGVPFSSRRIDHLNGDHPLPSDASLSASLELERIVHKIPSDAIVIALISGGTSSLVSLPPVGIHIDDIARTADILLKSGARISEMNTVRRHLCQLKGGQLAQKLKARHLITMVYSDVPGDTLHDIGSGLTVPDPSSYSDALHIIDRYELEPMLPVSILRYLKDGVEGMHPDTPKTKSSIGIDHQVVLTGSSGLLADKISEQAKWMGYLPFVNHPAYDTSARQLSRDIATRVRDCLQRSIGRQVLIFHGESTIQVTGGGKGGRNQELALLVSLALEEISVPWTLMSIGTDGIDGNTDAAGAFVYNGLLPMARHNGFSPEGYLLDNDSYHFFDGIDTLIRTGPTGNNMTDLQILILDP